MSVPGIVWDGTGAHAAEIVAALRADGLAATYRPAHNGAPARIITMHPDGTVSAVRAPHETENTP